MKILLIPIEKPEEEVKTGDWHQAIYHLLSQEHEVVGITRPRWQSLKGKDKNLILLFSWIKCFIYGLRHDYDLIYGVNTPSAFIGLLLSLLMHKPLAWDSGNPALFNPGRTQRLFFFLEKLIAKRATHIRMISTYYAETYTKFGFDKRKMTVVPHLVNLEYIDMSLGVNNSIRAKLAFDSEKIVMFMGQGALPTNAEAIQWIDSQVNAMEIKFVVAGSKPVEDCWETTFLGYVPNIYEYINACDLAIVPIWKESGAPVPSTRVTDFMSCGKAVVTTPYLLEVIPELRDSENIYIAEDGIDFLLKMRRALDNPEKSKEIGKQARKLIEEKYGWVSAKEWLGLLGK